MQWSDQLQEQTRETLRQMEVTRDLIYHLKHADGRLGALPLTDVVAGCFAVADVRSGAVTAFPDAEALIRDGWVLD